MHCCAVLCRVEHWCWPVPERKWVNGGASTHRRFSLYQTICILSYEDIWRVKSSTSTSPIENKAFCRD
jgi:hypothetical protein